MDKQEIKGAAKKVEGEVKKDLGKMTGNRRLEGEGEVDELEGEIREGIGRARRETKDALDDVDEAFDKP